MLTQRQANFYRRIVAAKLYIDMNYADNLDVRTISSETGFTQYDFIRQFYKTYGATPHQYLTKVRLNKAAELLESADIKIIDVCVAIGFTSTSSFSGLFKHAFGESPTSYKLSRMGRRDELAKMPRSFVPCCFQSILNTAGE